MKKTTFTEVRNWIDNVANGFNGAACYTPRFLKPYHLLILANELNRYSENEINLSSDLHRYATRMGLWEALGRKSPVTKKFTGQTKFLPIVPLVSTHEVQTSTEKLIEILKPHCFNAQTVESLFIMLLELLNNCFDHAMAITDLQGLVCCQPWVKGNLAQIAIVDSGLGIRATLKANSKLARLLKNTNSCELATKYGITGKPGKGHTGYGLTLTRDLIEKNLGNLLVISGSEAFQSCENQQTTSYLDAPWRGTIIILEWNTDRTLNTEEVYRNWPLPEGITNEDFSI